MTEHSARSKEAARLLGRCARQAVLATDRALYAAAAAKRLLALPEVARARTVLIYASTSEEIDTAPAIQALRRKRAVVALPRVAGPSELVIHRVDPGTPLMRGPFGLLEPPADAPVVDPGEVEVAIVPGVAFDGACRRVGRGAGYYDRLLAGMGQAVTVGLAFDGQLLDEVPCDEHDVCLDVLVTPTRTIRREGT
ncbi:MAG TPA: 5-formyltetrahydrofolate cyclo-ligase [Coriobacteriia bacterium]|nr:5-formyltetrahydrofolate cyclo-ligase [Coriobacteriia bacterium]